MAPLLLGYMYTSQTRARDRLTITILLGYLGPLSTMGAFTEQVLDAGPIRDSIITCWQMEN